ncbi:hypothetical protein WICPIJ_003302 [Wickerhamomyces pijperi]|uniref:Protein PNS1 n=1 Tax=Wickerhamomyces pijperi TaxID=599730 RepID=A0A9P8Q7D0_WICPI|nr:hypothetical protein WICPIJ_003302 [Wickerhamomyces pijperi]
MSEGKHQQKQQQQQPPVYDQSEGGDLGAQQPNYNQQQQQQTHQPPQFTQDVEYHGEPDKNEYNDDKPSVWNPDAETFDEAFKVEKPRLNDWPFTIFFIICCAGFIVIAAITLKEYAHTYSQQGSSIYQSTQSFTLNTNTVILFVFGVVISLVLAAGTLVLARAHPRGFIKLSIIVNVIMGIGTAIAYLVMRYWSAGIVFLVMTCISAWCYWSMRSRIPFSAEVLVTVINVMKKYPSTLIVSLVGAIVAGCFSVLFSTVVVATYMKYDPSSYQCTDPNGCSRAKLIGILFCVFFAGYYITEVIRNVIHVTISGVYGTWYYTSKSDQGEPKWPASGAFKRAMTYSFGSICFGSLIVTFVDLLRQGLNILKQSVASAGDGCAQCGFLVLDIVMGLVEWLARFFNQYSYSYISLYGDAYIPAAKATWRLIRQKGMDALVNQCLVGTALGFFHLFNGYVTALFAFLYLRLTKPDYNSDGSYYGPVVAFAFLIAVQISHVITQPLMSGTSTFFIALVRDPEVYMQSYPDRFETIAQTYPDIFDKLRSH